MGELILGLLLALSFQLLLVTDLEHDPLERVIFFPAQTLSFRNFNLYMGVA